MSALGQKRSFDLIGTMSALRQKRTFLGQHTAHCGCLVTDERRRTATNVHWWCWQSGPLRSPRLALEIQGKIPGKPEKSRSIDRFSRHLRAFGEKIGPKSRPN